MYYMGWRKCSHGPFQDTAFGTFWNGFHHFRPDYKKEKTGLGC
jgi:hypothetical protein